MNQVSRVAIAINVMRARLTIVGFNIAIVSFQLSELLNLAGGITVSGFDHAIHFRADLALFISLALSLMALIAFMSSSAMDKVGVCDHWLFLVGDLLMYLALANTVTGFFSPINDTFQLIAHQLPVQHAQVLVLADAVYYLGGLVWLSAIYFGPAVTFLRSPFSNKVTINLVGVYIILLLITSWISYQAFLLEMTYLTPLSKGTFPYFYALFQPLLW